jgi:cytochrome c oxidase subunit II
MKQKCKLRVLLVGMLATAIFSAPTVWAQATPQKIDITAKQWAYSPAEITVKKGQPVVLVMKSDDAAHGIRFRDLNVEVKVGPHGTAEVQFTPQETGDFVGHCFVFCGKGHGSMTLILHVVA